MDGAGRGVFASKDIKKGELIEECPVLELIGEAEKLKKMGSELYSYYFLWPKMPDSVIALGYGSIYNHSYNPNATYKKNIEEKSIDFIAIQDIKKDEEITVNYNFGNPDDKSELWIKSIKPVNS